MLNSAISNPESFLLEIIEKESPLVWRRYQARYPIRWVNGHFKHDEENKEPPYVAFRFKEESDEIIQKINRLIEVYEGAVKWEMKGRNRCNLPGVNWVIRPQRVSEVEPLAEQEAISPDEYLAKYEPNFAAIAFDDFNQLTKYIERNLN